MTRYTLSEFYNIRRSMKKRLAVYMITLGIILAAALIAGLFFFNQLKSPQEELCTSLSFRMEAFETDMKSMWRNVSVMGVHLSEDMSAIVQRQTSKLSALDGSADAMERLEEAMLEPLCQYVRQADCSGAFVVLNTSLGGEEFRGGLYVQRSNSARIASDLLLYRGMAGVGRSHGVMPHRKWAQEFELSEFSELAGHLNTASAPIDRSCRTTSLLTLPGTSERAMLLTVPMLGADGTVYGLCGFEISESYFKQNFAQPTGFDHLICLLAPADNGLNASAALSSGTTGAAHVRQPGQLGLHLLAFQLGLTQLTGPDSAYAGISRIGLVQRGAAGGHPAVVVRELVGLELHAPLAVGHHAVGLAHLRV